MRDTSTILRSQRDALRNLPPEQFKAAMLAIMDYEMDGIIANDEPIAAFALGMAKPLIDKRERRSAAGKGNAERRWKSDAEGMPTDANECEPMPIDANGMLKEENRKKKVESIKEKKICVRFAPPTTEEVRAYITEKGYSVDPEKFVDFYESKGWMVGKNKMKDWKAAVRTWARSQREETTAKGTNRFINFQQSGTDWDAVADKVMEAELWEN